jgi:L,D-peptidoglycan transpeptidase YkuD (ErfK/YbiS/YcfS/YnhG family)
VIDQRLPPRITPACASLGKRRTAWLPYLHCSLLIWIAALLSSCSLQHAERAGAALPWADARQLVLVTMSDWNATQGTLRMWSRTAEGWRAAREAIPVVIGRAGTAWGVGLHPAQSGPVKHEGDGRSPAGVFTIGTAFGYAPAEPTELPYAALSADDWCVDVSGSPLYNRIVDARDVGSAAVEGSTEPMRRDLHENGDQAYKIGFVVGHNPRGEPGAGSCIFVHLWKSVDSTTSGCTAMAEPALRRLLRWLQPAQHPVFVLLPQAEYERLRSSWGLPGPVAS